jgi:hypothetical protein
MEFAHDAHAKAYEHVKQLMTELYGESISVNDKFPGFAVGAGSTTVNVVVLPWGDSDACVKVLAWVIIGAELAPDLMKYLLQKNDDALFGGFGIDSEGDIFFKHTILATDLDKSELRSTIGAVRFSADEQDDLIQQRWGGQRLADR